MKNLFIGGCWVAGNGKVFTSIDPATELSLWEGPAADAKQCAAAVAAARVALPDWSGRTLDQRTDIIRKFGVLIGEEREALARLIAQETGKPLWDCAGEVAPMAARWIKKSALAYVLENK